MKNNLTEIYVFFFSVSTDNETYFVNKFGNAGTYFETNH
jgi:hypothetical protein